MTQTVEVIQVVDLSYNNDDMFREVEFAFDMVMTSPGCRAQLSGPPENCYPAEAAEFELNSIHVIAEDGNHIEISHDIFAALVGAEMEENLIRNAEEEAAEKDEY